MNTKTHNQIREILDFALNEPESIQDLTEMVKQLPAENLEMLSRIAYNLIIAAQVVTTGREKFAQKLASSKP